jgi:large subunit ribosomal protein L25
VGVKVQGGIVDWVTRELEVECLPADIPEKIVVDVSNLELGKHLRVADLVPPAKVKILTEADVVVVHVVAPRAEEAPAAVEAAPVEGAVAEPEVIKKGKAVAEGETAEEPKAAEKPEKKAEKKEKK